MSNLGLSRTLSHLYFPESLEFNQNQNNYLSKWIKIVVIYILHVSSPIIKIVGEDITRCTAFDGILLFEMHTHRDNTIFWYQSPQERAIEECAAP